LEFIDVSEFRGAKAWDAIDVTEISEATVRLHWTDKPYEWHVNDGPEVFVVLGGAVDMHYKDGQKEKVQRLTSGLVCLAQSGDEHVAHPVPDAHILVVERKGSR
jgi:mannose-6-phosphate isomerase-like protein (cupin superfamily)